MTTIRITLSPDAYLPTRGSAGSSGYDLYAPRDLSIEDGRIDVICTGVCIELPNDSWEAQVRPRSSMSKRGLWASLGVIDSDYRGPIGVVLANFTGGTALIHRGDRIAQLVLARVEHPMFSEVHELSATARGTGGFGSSGR